METKNISAKQAISIMILFILGSTMVFGGSNEAGQDSWITFIYGTIMILPIIFVYIRIAKLFPQKDIYQVFYIIFGKIGGCILSVIFLFYALQIASVNIRAFTEFIQVQSLTSTPQLVVALAIGFIVFITLKYGISLLGRGSVWVVPIVMISMGITVVLLIKDMHFNFIRPIGGEGFTNIMKGSFGVFTYPFGALVLFTAVLQKLNPKEKLTKVYFKSIFISSIILLILVLRNILVLGAPTLDSIFFNSYITVTIIDIADFITRIEVLVAGNFIVCGLVRISICIYVACKGITRVFHIKNYKTIVASVTLLGITISGYMFNSTMELFNFLSIYKFYGPIFQVFIPIFTWIFAEIKVKKESKNQYSGNTMQTQQAAEYNI